MAIGDKIRKATATLGNDEHWIYRLRYAIMLEIEDFKRRLDLGVTPLSKTQIDALKPKEQMAYRFSQTSKMLDEIASIGKLDPVRSADLANELADYFLAHTQDPSCSIPWGLSGAILETDIGL